MPRISHVCSLHSLGGVQRSFANFIEAAMQFPGWENQLISSSRPHPHIRKQVEATGCSIYLRNRWGPIPIPKIPPSLRQARLVDGPRRFQADACLLWDYSKNARFVETMQRDGRRVIYFERGAAWATRGDAGRRALLASVDGILCNSQAAARMLALRWNVTCPVHLCRNAVRPDVRPDSGFHVQTRAEGPLILGIAGRLHATKGVVIGAHVVRQLIDAGVDACLLVAGNGPELARLHAAARRLGVAERTFECGLVADMGEFYRRLDVLLVPSASEAFGLVSIEAQAWGVPVVATRVDGLPETLVEGESGLTVPPGWTPEEYAANGGGQIEGHRDVYLPERDALAPFRFPEPHRIADAIMDLAADRTRLHRFRVAAARVGAEQFSWERHCQQIREAVETLLAGDA